MSVQQFSVDTAMVSDKFKELRKVAYAKVWDGYSQQEAWLLWNVLDVLMENHDGLTWMDREKENRDVNVYPHQHTWKIVDDVTLHGKAKWVACSECGKLDCDYIDEVLGLVKSTAKGALVANERDKNAMKKAMEAIGLLNSMVAGGEEHSETSRKLVEGAVVDLLHAMQFKVEETKNGSQLSS